MDETIEQLIKEKKEENKTWTKPKFTLRKPTFDEVFVAGYIATCAAYVGLVGYALYASVKNPPSTYHLTFVADETETD